MKKTKLMARVTTANIGTGDKDIAIVISFCLLRSSINIKGTRSQEIHNSLALGRAAIKSLEKIFGCYKT